MKAYIRNPETGEYILSEIHSCVHVLDDTPILVVKTQLGYTAYEGIAGLRLTFGEYRTPNFTIEFAKKEIENILCAVNLWEEHKKTWREVIADMQKQYDLPPYPKVEETDA